MEYRETKTWKEINETPSVISKIFEINADTMSKLVKENSDILVKIPMKGKITSLNASVSAGIVTYEIVKQRNC